MGIFDNYLRPKLDMDVTTIIQAANALCKAGVESGVSAQYWANAIENAVRSGEIQTLDDFYYVESMLGGETIKKERDYHGGVQLYTAEVKRWLDRNNQIYPADLFGDNLKKKADLIDWQNDPNLTKLEKQQKAIVEVIGLKGYSPMKIPDGGKGVIKQICESEYSNIFDADSSFNTAWKKSRKLFRMDNHESYSRRGKK